MTDTNQTHSPSPEQLERTWALRAARDVVTVKAPANIFTSPAETIDAFPKGLIKLATYIIGEGSVQTAADPEEQAHRLVEELDQVQLIKLSTHAFSHTGVPLTILGDLTALAEMDEDELNAILDRARSQVDAIPERTKDVREAGAFFELIEGLVKDVDGDDSHETVVDEGSLIVKEKEAPQSTGAETESGSTEKD